MSYNKPSRPASIKDLKAVIKVYESRIATKRREISEKKSEILLLKIDITHLQDSRTNTIKKRDKLLEG